MKCINICKNIVIYQKIKNLTINLNYQNKEQMFAQNDHRDPRGSCRDRGRRSFPVCKRKSGRSWMVHVWQFRGGIQRKYGSRWGKLRYFQRGCTGIRWDSGENGFVAGLCVPGKWQHRGYECVGTGRFGDRSGSGSSHVRGRGIFQKKKTQL